MIVTVHGTEFHLTPDRPPEELVEMLAEGILNDTEDDWTVVNDAFVEPGDSEAFAALERSATATFIDALRQPPQGNDSHLRSAAQKAYLDFRSATFNPCFSVGGSSWLEVLCGTDIENLSVAQVKDALTPDLLLSLDLLGYDANDILQQLASVLHERILYLYENCQHVFPEFDTDALIRETSSRLAFPFDQFEPFLLNSHENWGSSQHPATEFLSTHLARVLEATGVGGSEFQSALRAQLAMDQIDFEDRESTAFRVMNSPLWHAIRRIPQSTAPVLQPERLVAFLQDIDDNLRHSPEPVKLYLVCRVAPSDLEKAIKFVHAGRVVEFEKAILVARRCDNSTPVAFASIDKVELNADRLLTMTDEHFIFEGADTVEETFDITRRHSVLLVDGEKIKPTFGYGY